MAADNGGRPLDQSSSTIGDALRVSRNDHGGRAMDRDPLQPHLRDRA